MNLKFTKMQAFGNDYVYIDAIHQKLDDLSNLAKFVSDRHFGIGSDGLVLICKSNVASVKMRIFNPDGTEAEMCGNALRSVAKFVYDKGIVENKEFTIETLGGIKNIKLQVLDNEIKNIKASIGSPIFKSSLIPVNTSKEKFIMEEVLVLDTTFKMSSLSWGNPHTVIFVSDVDNFDVAKYGKAIENKLDLFPKRTNVTFAEIISRDEIKIREWERGTGETLGCATGSASAVVIANVLGLVNNKCKVKQSGGEIAIEYIDNNLTMIGPSTTVFEGEFNFLGGEKN